MDYEKKYKEALEWARKVMQGKVGFVLDEVLEKFPELKESEDERIRKSIIAIINNYVDNSNTFKPEMIAWLEKQGEPQVRTGIEWVNTIDDACDKRYSEEYAHGEYCHEQSFKWGFQEGVDWFEKQGEQKLPIEKLPFEMKTVSESLGFTSKKECDDYNKMVTNLIMSDDDNGEQKELKKEKVDNLHNYLYGEQKPAAWSKEDDYVIERLFCLLHNEQDKYPQQSSEFQELEEIENKLESFKYRLQPQSKWSEEDEKEMGRVIYMMEQLDLTESWSDCYTFLNSLKDRMQLKQEWSEEDERIYKSIIYSFAHNYPLTVQQQGFVKSLRPQNTWKPSEEEMIALEHAINCYSGISPTNTNEVFILEIMKERLKNLTK